MSKVIADIDKLNKKLNTISSTIKQKAFLPSSTLLNFYNGDFERTINNFITSQSMISTLTVIGGTKPNNPKENTIWINTPEFDNNYVIDTIAPAASAGKIWIKLNKNGKYSFQIGPSAPAMVRFSKIYQYNNGWEKINFSLYQNGKWHQEWNGELYNRGNEYTEITGGWITSPVKAYSACPPSNCSVSKEADRMIFYLKPGGGILHPRNRIDLTGFSRIILDGSYSEAPGRNWQHLRVWSSLGGNAEENLLGNVVGGGNTTLDISGINGKQVIGISGYTGTVTINSIYLE